jgi:hypothetical protein
MSMSKESDRELLAVVRLKTVDAYSLISTGM